MPVAIIDDDSKAAQVTRMTVEDADLETFILGRDPRIHEVAKDAGIRIISQTILDSADAVVCDHRLRPGGFAPFDGAELVAALIGKGVPAILISQFVDQDYDVSIRHWRVMLPSVLSRDSFGVDTFKEGLAVCKNEIGGIFTPQRRRHRVLVRVVDIQSEASEPVIDAIIPAWSNNSAVRFPFAIVPYELQGSLLIGAYLIAQVNLGADRPEDLYFDKFENPPTPNDAIFDNI